MKNTQKHTRKTTPPKTALGSRRQPSNHPAPEWNPSPAGAEQQVPRNKHIHLRERESQGILPSTTTTTHSTTTFGRVDLTHPSHRHHKQQQILREGGISSTLLTTTTTTANSTFERVASRAQPLPASGRTIDPSNNHSNNPRPVAPVAVGRVRRVRRDARA